MSTKTAPTYTSARDLFIRGVGGVYVLAFLSLWTQVHGLFGEQGILPATELMAAVRAQRPDLGFVELPTVLWFGAGDVALHLICAVGVLAGVLLTLRVAPILSAATAWLAYLSIATVGRVFLDFQWDALLLETGLLTIVYAAPGWLPRRGTEAPPSLLARWLVYVLLFKFMFLSGVVKLTWDDRMWLELRALDYHFWTQPLPTWSAWYAHQLPGVVKQGLVGVMFVLEVGFPFLVFVGARARRVAFVGLVALQLGILATGSYGFFNALSLVLLLPLLDDAVLRRFTWLGGDGVSEDAAVSVASAAAADPAASTAPAVAARSRFALLWSWAPVPLALLVAATTPWQLLGGLRYDAGAPRAIRRIVEIVSPLRSFNSYGLFRVMTTSRREIVLEGSDDGVRWLAYELPYQPGDPLRSPRTAFGHMPRVDWQMWFAALGEPRGNEWLVRMMDRLLRGSPDVQRLVSLDPFEGRPPRLLRTRLYEYRFATAAERAVRSDGGRPGPRDGGRDDAQDDAHGPGRAFWSRTPLGSYLPVVLSLDESGALVGQEQR